MIRTLLALCLCLSATFLPAQNCEPDMTYADSSAGVYPEPYEPTINPDGGITDSAYINHPFSFTLTIVINDTLVYQGISFPLDSIVISQVNGLPVGLNYSCEPTSCHFLKNTIGCAKLFGTPLGTNTPGAYDLTITGAAYINGSNFPFPITFPDANLAPGKYTINLNPDPTATNDLRDKVSILTQPNPTAGPTQLRINSQVSGQFRMQVVDLLGQAVEQREVAITTGENTLDFDASRLSNGMYLLLIQKEIGLVSQKILVQH